MKQPSSGPKGAARALKLALLLTAGFVAKAPRGCASEASPKVTVWDVAARFPAAPDLGNRAGWAAVPANLLALEAEPAAAISDPGYYGREYVFKGDAVIENERLGVAFRSDNGLAAIFAKGSKGGARCVGELALLGPGGPLTAITGFQILRNAADQAVVEVGYTGAGSADASAVFTLGRSGFVAIKPSGNVKTVRFQGPIAYAVAPNFVGDDWIFGPAEAAAPTPLTLPGDGMLMALERGEADEVVLTWPGAGRNTRLNLGPETGGKRTLESIDLDPAGERVFLAPLTAPGIWRRETLRPEMLEKDVTSEWSPPFPARWKTQLDEAGVRTTFAFRESKGTIWRGVPGGYDYPVWLDPSGAHYHLGKKVPPKGESLIYSLEGQNTPGDTTTPVDILQATLGVAAAETILDVEGRKLRTHHRRGGDGVHRACTCGYTEAIQAVFEKGDETGKRQFIHDAVDDMIFFVKTHLGRIEEYRRFAEATTTFLKERKTAAPELKAYIEELEPIVESIPQEYAAERENMKSLQYAGVLADKTMALTRQTGPKNLANYMELLKDWRGMGGSQDYVVAKCHAVTRQLLQQAGYAAAADPRAAELAREVAARCKAILRNPDGYEIWPNY